VGGLGCDFKRQRIVKKNSWQKKWSGLGRTGDYDPKQTPEPPPSAEFAAEYLSAENPLENVSAAEFP